MKKNKPRNHVALNPLLRKGGAHVRARSGERFADKQKIRKAMREWQGSRDFPGDDWRRARLILRIAAPACRIQGSN